MKHEMMRIWHLLLIGIFCFPCFSIAMQKEEIKEIIQTIPSADLKILEDFFRELLFCHGFAYTLYGDKPMSVESFDLGDAGKSELFCTSSDGFKIWKKYAHLFPSKNHIFLFYEDKEKDSCEISLINKHAFQQIISKNKEKFSEVLGLEISPEKLLALLMQQQSLENTLVKDREDLIGILFGYGKTNAELFQKRNEIWRKKVTLKKKRTIPSFGYHSIDEELRALNNSLQFFSKDGRFSLNYMRLPSFVADSEKEETIQLKKKYIDQRKRITKQYAKGKILEITLEKLCAE